MRTLCFIVNNKTIKPDPSCDFGDLFPGKNPNIQAEFVFSPEWENALKVVAFWSMLDKEYEPQLLENNTCVIPEEALSRASFKVQVLGKKQVSPHKIVALTTDKFTVRQSGGKLHGR